jgi:MinD superfamily P-loop ATPase
MKELVIISGKGGTGKTSVTAAFSTLADNKVIADCDVDAADLHILLHPDILERHPFEGGSTAVIDKQKCTLCGQCLLHCRFSALSQEIEVNPFLCEGCGVCKAVCPEEAIQLKREKAGQWFISQTAYGPFVHAQLGIAQENSGWLVAQVRTAARKIAENKGHDLIISDGSPGIGCSVISSITGTDLVLIVTEPTLSGIHDLERVLTLTAHFKIKTLVCINKFDINQSLSEIIEHISREKSISIAGRIPYDRTITEAQINGVPVTEYKNSQGAASIKALWEVVDFTIKGRHN